MPLFFLNLPFHLTAAENIVYCLKFNLLILMKNKLLCLLIIGILLPGIIHSRVISKEKALQTAMSFYYGNGVATRSSQNALGLLWDSNELSPNTKAGIQAPSYYVFTPQTGNGFIIISGDDIIEPVLGYSHKYQAPQSNDMAPALKAWLEDIDNYINIARIKGVQPDEKTAASWVQTKSGSYGNGALLETALWKQRSPFNKECPLDNGEPTLTGCVATAVGIVMYYHKWPDAGVGQTEQYVIDNKITVKARNLEKPYNWEKMLPEYKSNSYSTEQANEVSRLLADIGAAYKAKYGVKATSASTNTNEMYKFFKYDSGMSQIARKDFFAEQFDNILKKEIDNRRPVLYAARNDEDGGHAFVIDGYDKDGFFHINWGWGGTNNGYYAITDHEYTNKQRAFINIVPATGNNNVPENWITVYGKGMTSTVEDMENYKQNEYFTLRILTNNRSAIDFKGFIRAAIVNRAGEVKEWIMDEREYELAGKMTEGETSAKSVNITCKFIQEPAIGDKIRLFYRTKGENGWHTVLPDPVDWSDIMWEIPIEDEYYIRESTSVKFDKTKKALIITYKKGVVPTIMLGNSTVTEGITSNETSVTIEGIKVQGEKYRIRLEKRKELEEFEFSAKSM